jgi:tetratricopeptide (TPR) repeat protein
MATQFKIDFGDLTFGQVQPERKELKIKLNDPVDVQRHIDSASRGFARSEMCGAIAEAYKKKGDVDNALKHYEMAANEIGASHVLLHNYAFYLAGLGRIAEAETRCASAYAHSRGDMRVQYLLSILRLMQGKFKEGWPDYKARFHMEKGAFWRRHYNAKPLPSFTSDIYDASAGQSLLIIMDQGLGEEIMFASLFNEVVAKWRGSITVECSNRLIPLFKRSWPMIDFVGRQSITDLRITTVEYDYWTTLADIAKDLRTCFEDFPYQDGYLEALGDISYDEWGEGKRIVGISWETRVDDPMAKAKSIPIEKWVPVLKNQDTKFVSLQYLYDKTELDAAGLAANNAIGIDPSVDAFKDIERLASQIMAMELVITTSNTTAHLAGALGVPTWLLAPKGTGAMWHWFDGMVESPWYPSMQIIRQHKPGDWDQVMQRVAAELENA